MVIGGYFENWGVSDRLRESQAFYETDCNEDIWGITSLLSTYYELWLRLCQLDNFVFVKKQFPHQNFELKTHQVKWDHFPRVRYVCHMNSLVVFRKQTGEKCWNHFSRELKGPGKSFVYYWSFWLIKLNTHTCRS